jgi:Fe-Mn family superoxide dismutase
MLPVYGVLMPIRVLEEIRFWKTQEREHTEVIRALAPDLEAPFVKLMKAWERVFEQSEMAAVRLLEAALRGGLIVTPEQRAEVEGLLAASAAQSQQWVQQLAKMEQESAPIRSRPVVKAVIQHIIRESEYFLGVLEAGDPLLAAFAPPVPLGVGRRKPPAGAAGTASDSAPTPFPEEAQTSGEAPADSRELVYLHASPVPAGDGYGADGDERLATGEGAWSTEALEAAPVPVGGHRLPPLPYAYDALEPVIDEATMRLHHDKHHQSYVDGLNRAEKKLAEARAAGDFSLVKHWERELAFHGAGHYLHTLFWNAMSPKGGGRPSGALAAAIDASFGSFEKFRSHFSEAANQVEGGGWALLVWSPRSRRLEILQAEKHQNLSQQDIVPLLPLDVWEHSYYLKYRNERAKYVAAWWNVVNWPHIEERFAKARQLRWPAF